MVRKEEEEEEKEGEHVEHKRIFLFFTLTNHEYLKTTTTNQENFKTFLRELMRDLLAQKTDHFKNPCVHAQNLCVFTHARAVFPGPAP